MDVTSQYRDGRITCDDVGIRIRWYFFPAGSKLIPWSGIAAVTRLEMTGAVSGRYRIWGSGDFRHWFHLDGRRPKKSVAFVIDKGEWVRAVVTPDDPEAFGDVLEARGIRIRRAG